MRGVTCFEDLQPVPHPMWVLSDRLQFCPIAQGGGVLPVPPSRRPRRIEKRTLGRSVGALKRNSRGDRRFWGARSPASRRRSRASASSHAHAHARGAPCAGPRLARPRPRPPRSSAVAGGGGGAWRAGARGRCRLKRAGRRKAGCAIMAAGWFLTGTRAHLRGKLLGSEPRSVGRLRKFRKWAERPPRFLPLTHAERNFIQEFGSGQPAAGPRWQEID